MKENKTFLKTLYGRSLKSLTFIMVLLIISFFSFGAVAATKKPAKSAKNKTKIELTSTLDSVEDLTVTIQYIQGEKETTINNIEDIKGKTIIAKIEDSKNFRLSIQAPKDRTLSGEVKINNDELISLTGILYEVNLKKDDIVSVKSLNLAAVEGEDSKESIDFTVINDWGNPKIKSVYYNNDGKTDLITGNEKNNSFSEFKSIFVTAEDNTQLEKLYYKFGSEDFKSVSLTDDGEGEIPAVTKNFDGKLTIYVKDVVGNSSEEKVYNLKIGATDEIVKIGEDDTTPPVITEVTYNTDTPIQLKTEGNNIFNDYKSITVKATDNDPSIKLYYKFNDKAWNELSFSEGKCTIPVITENFNGTLTIYVEDSAKNKSAEKTYNLILDKTAPIIEKVTYNISENPSLEAGGIYLFNEYKDITVEASDNNSLEKLYYKYNNGEEESASLSKGNYTIPAVTADFKGTLTIYVKDIAGNKSDEKTYNLAIDKTAPKIENIKYGGVSLVSPFNSSDINKKITFKITDSNDVTVLYKFSVGTIDDLPHDTDGYDLLTAGGDGLYTISLPGAEYTGGLTLKVYDKLNNTTKATYSLTIKKYESLTIENLKYNNEEIPNTNSKEKIFYSNVIDGKISFDIYGTENGIKSIQYSVNDGSFTDLAVSGQTNYQISIPTGQFNGKITIKVKDNSDKEITKEIYLCADNKAPEILIGKMDKGNFTELTTNKIILNKDSNREFSILLYDATSGLKDNISIKLGNSDIGFDKKDGVFKYKGKDYIHLTLTLPNESFNKDLLIKAADKAGNELSFSIPVVSEIASLEITATPLITWRFGESSSKTTSLKYPWINGEIYFEVKNLKTTDYTAIYKINNGEAKSFILTDKDTQIKKGQIKTPDGEDINLFIEISDAVGNKVSYTQKFNVKSNPELTVKTDYVPGTYTNKNQLFDVSFWNIIPDATIYYNSGNNYNNWVQVPAGGRLSIEAPLNQSSITSRVVAFKAVFKSAQSLGFPKGKVYEIISSPTTIIYDLQGPTINPIYGSQPIVSGAKIPATAIRSPVDMFFNVTDNISGLKKLTVRGAYGQETDITYLKRYTFYMPGYYSVEAADNLGNTSNMYFYINIDDSPVITEPDPKPEPKPTPEEPKPDKNSPVINIDNISVNLQGQQSGISVNSDDLKDAVNVSKYIDSNTKSLNLKLITETYTINGLYDILREIERADSQYVKENTDIISAWNLYPTVDKMVNNGTVSNYVAAINEPINFKMKITADTTKLDNLKLVEIRNGNAYRLNTTFSKEDSQNYLNFTLTANAKIALIYDRKMADLKPNPPTGDTVIFIWSILAVVALFVLISVFYFWKKEENHKD